MEKERYRIKGKTYYKVGEEQVNPSDRDLVSEIWKLENPKGEKFKLLIRYGRSNTFTLYTDEVNTKQIYRTYSISRITR